MTVAGRLSVVTLSYNQAPYLERALRSVLDQPGVDLEYIVVDAGSTDGSREIIERYRPRLSHVVLEPDAGPADGLNKGLARATGEVFYYLNSDDEVAPGAFAEALAALAERPGAAAVYGNGWLIDPQGRRLRPLYSARRPSARNYARGIDVFVQQATFLRTQALRSVGGFPVENRVSWDGEVMFELLRQGFAIERVWRFWGLFRWYPETISASGRLAEQARIHHARMAATLPPPGPAEGLAARAAYLRSRATDWRQLAHRAGFALGRAGG
jgi:glycosyltransferase involved in cell wall biosynthesis